MLLSTVGSFDIFNSNRQQSIIDYSDRQGELMREPSLYLKSWEVPLLKLVVSHTAKDWIAVTRRHQDHQWIVATSSSTSPSQPLYLIFSSAQGCVQRSLSRKLSAVPVCLRLFVAKKWPVKIPSTLSVNILIIIFNCCSKSISRCLKTAASYKLGIQWLCTSVSHNFSPFTPFTLHYFPIL